MKNRVTKAVFPVAGLGTRFLPATKASAKEMLPIVDKPLIQYAAEEAVAAGITELIFVTGRNKRSIEDHFDKAYELEAELAIAGKVDLLDQARDLLPPEVTCIYVRQAQALGLGHAVLCARSLIGDEAFAVLLADDLIDAQPFALQQMTQRFEMFPVSILGVERIAREDSPKYGVVSVHAGEIGERMHRMKGIVEKPQPEQAPSDLGVVGRYILTPRVFDHLAAIRPGAGGEIQLTDGIAALINEQAVMAYEFDGTRFDCGSKLGYLKATLSYALKHPEVAQDFAQHLRQMQIPG
jgi:UTP--glucose-1-phosphate uridylyltransferase